MNAKQRLARQRTEYEAAPPAMLSSTILNITDWGEIIVRLRNAGIPVVQEKIDIEDFEKWMGKFPALVDFYQSIMDEYFEKLLEHYLSYKYLDLQPGDFFIDIAANTSPWADIIKESFPVQAFKQDLAFDNGIHGNRIGGDAAAMPLDDESVDAMALHCSFECFQGDSDLRFIKESERILKKGGRFVILPLYFAAVHFVSTAPSCDKKNINVEKNARWVWRDDCWQGSPFSRHYSPEVFKDRVYDSLQNLQGKIIHFVNVNELREKFNQRLFCSLMFYAAKQ